MVDNARLKMIRNKSKRFIKGSGIVIRDVNNFDENILDENWDSLFHGEYDPGNIYYVYYHTLPFRASTNFNLGRYIIRFAGRPFYIGKGKDNRYLSLDRNIGHLNRLKKLMALK